MDITLYGLLMGKIKQAFSKEKFDEAVSSYLEENPISSGATEEQVAQIEENTTNLNNKLDKNQGAENSGKITVIDESGNIIPMVPSGVTYNEETNCLEYGVDERLNLNAGIQLDDTLTKSGYAADAASVGELKSDIVSLKNGYQHINDFTVFINGSRYLGNYEDKKYRVTTENTCIFDRDITLIVEDGFRFIVEYIENGSFKKDTGWLVENHTVVKGTNFNIIIARVSEDTSEIANVNEFCSKLKIQSKIDYKLWLNEININNIKSDCDNFKIGVDNLNNYGEFIRGSLYLSTLENKNYRVCSNTLIHFNRDVILNVADGFRIVIEYYNSDGSYKNGYDTSWLTGSYTILKDEYVKFNIARIHDNTSEIADVNEFVSKLCFETELFQRISKIENKIPTNNFVETPWVQEIHRGLTSDTIPENTIPSFLEVAKNGFKQFECDVRKTSDGILVMSHDAEFNGYVVSETDYETLNSVVISTDSVYGEIHIAKFEDVLKVAYFNDLTINIDIKDSSAINDVVNMVIANGMIGRAIYNPNTGETSVGLSIMEIDKRATVVYPYNKDNIENYYPQSFVDKSRIIIGIPWYNVTDEAIDVIRASGFKSLIYDVLNSTWFEKRPDIIEYRTASASTINELNKTYLDGIIY